MTRKSIKRTRNCFKVQSIIFTAVIILITQTCFASSPLHIAVKSLDTGLFARFIDNPSMLNATDSLGMTPLHHACSLGVVEMTTQLLEAGADPSLTCLAGKNALHYSVNVGAICLDPETPDVGLTICPLTIPKMLASRDIDINSRDNAGDTALHLASRSGMVAVIAALINDGADVNKVDASGNTPLHLVGGPLPHVAAQVLLLNGADTKVENAQGLTPLQKATEQGNLILINMIRKYAISSSNQ